MLPRTIVASNVNRALQDGLWELYGGRITDSRVGRVIRTPGPVITTYTHPEQRVLFSALRDANPFFHLYECLWMMAGRCDAASVTRYAKNMDMFAEDTAVGRVLMGAYGQRWRDHFDFDQIAELVNLIKKDPGTRRAVLGMWSPKVDLLTAEGSKDVPCNTQVYFDGTLGKLDMTVCNRSNDIVWGAYGANAVHMSFLHEFMALATGLPLGVYHQFSNNFHLYLDREDTKRLITVGDTSSSIKVHYTIDDRYANRLLKHYPIMAPGTDWASWLVQAEIVAEDPSVSRPYYDPFFREVFHPMMVAHAHYRDGDFRAALQLAMAVQADDWRIAAVEWLERRAQKREA